MIPICNDSMVALRHLFCQDLWTVRFVIKMLLQMIPIRSIIMFDSIILTRIPVILNQILSGL